MDGLKIEVKTTDVETFSGIAAASKKPYTINKQAAWLHTPTEPYPTKIELMLKDATKPYQLGVYGIDFEKSVYVDRNGRMAITPVLITGGAAVRKTA